MTGRVSVIGAGITGLTCAVRLAEAGLQVDVLARELPLETSSAASAGLCLPPGPELMSGGDVPRWAARTFAALRELADVPEAGISVVEGLLGPGAPRWPDELGTRPRREHDPAPWHAEGWAASLPVADLDVHLAHLVRRLDAAGGTLTRMALAALPERGVVVNCTGVAARALAPDPAVRPVRAQLLRLSDPGLSGWWSDPDPAAAVTVVPHGSHVAVGGPVTDDDFTPTPDRETAELLHRRAAALVPELGAARVLGHRVAVRPSRPAVRLEAVGGPGRTVVHCYGHGAAALALAWGCADDVLAAVQEATINT